MKILIICRSQEETQSVSSICNKHKHPDLSIIYMTIGTGICDVSMKMTQYFERTPETQLPDYIIKVGTCQSFDKCVQGSEFVTSASKLFSSNTNSWVFHDIIATDRLPEKRISSGDEYMISIPNDTKGTQLYDNETAAISRVCAFYEYIGFFSYHVVSDVIEWYNDKFEINNNTFKTLPDIIRDIYSAQHNF